MYLGEYGLWWGETKQASRENTRVRIYEVLEYRSVIARRVTYTISRLVAEPSEQR